MSREEQERKLKDPSSWTHGFGGMESLVPVPSIVDDDEITGVKITIEGFHDPQEVILALGMLAARMVEEILQASGGDFTPCGGEVHEGLCEHHQAEADALAAEAGPDLVAGVEGFLKDLSGS